MPQIKADRGKKPKQNKNANSPQATCSHLISFKTRSFLQALLALFLLAISANAADPPEIRAGSELDFRPYCFTDKDGQPTGFGVELLRAVAEKATLRLRISPGEWDKVWKELVAGEIDVLPVVARTPSREGLVEFTLPHTETFDAFFVREGLPPIKDLGAAAGKEIVVLRSDAAHHQLVERKFPGKIVPVDSIAEGLRLIAAGKHDALLCSRLIGVLERDQAGIKGVTDGPVIPDYKRVFSFAVRKGNAELVERLNQGLRIVKADGTYDRLYSRWLGGEVMPPWWQTYFWQAIGVLGVLVLIAVTWVVARKALESDYRQSQILTLHRAPPKFWPYALAVVAAAAGYALRIGLEAWVGRGLPTFITFYPAVMTAALLGGIGPGLVATALTAMIVAIWVMAPIGQLSIASSVDVLAVVLFCVLGMFMTAVAELHRRNRAKAAAFDRDEALRETRREKEFLANLLEAAEQPFATGYPDGRIGLINRAYERLTGYTASELHALDWSTVLTPPEWCDHERLKLEELRRTGQPVRYEKEYIRKDGTRVPIELLVSLSRDAAGRPEFYYSFLTDITARKEAESALRESEQRFRSYFELGLIGMAITLPTKGMVEVNDEICRFLGYSRSELLAKDWAEITHPEDLASDVVLFERVLAGKLDAYTLDKRLIRKDGRIMHSVISVRAVRQPDGSVDYFVALVQDVTERKKAEEELIRNQRALQEANATLERKVEVRTQELAHRVSQLRSLTGELTLAEQRERSRLAIVLHDHLQQLLVAAKFRLTILGRGGDDIIKQAAKEVEQLIDDSIASSRSLTAELSPPILQEAGLNAGLQWLARRMADTQGLFVDLELNESGPLSDDVKILLFQSIRELLFNVVKHANTRSAVVNLRRFDGSLQITVSDQGSGFDPAATSAPGEDTRGFGLFGIRERLGFMGGTLEIDSCPGQGSRFVLSVPIAPVSAAKEENEKTLVLPAASSRSSKYPDSERKIRVLLADDHAVVRQGIANLLADESDMEVIGEAADGQEVIELAARLLPDVVLMDVSMPKLSGVEATRAIHNRFPDTCIIGLSMFEDVEQAQAMRDAGAVDYLTKTGQANTLVNAIRKNIQVRAKSHSAQSGTSPHPNRDK